MLIKERENANANGMEKKAFLKGAMTVSIAGILSKLLGAVYKIPLAYALGAHGLGLYQMAYPAYSLLLALSATGIPSAVATLTAEKIANGKCARSVFSTACRFFFLLGLVGAVLMASLSPVLALAQGERSVVGGYIALAPSVLFSSLIAVLRGYLQGHGNLRPTAVSEIIEQSVKVSVGTLILYRLQGDVVQSVTMLLWTVTVAESVALLYLVVCKKRLPAPLKTVKTNEKLPLKHLLALSLPVTASSLAYPLSAFLDSVVTVRLLRVYTADATALYGLFSGGAITVATLPATALYGLSVAVVPAVVSAKTKAKKGANNADRFAFAWTVSLAVLGATCLFAFAPYAVKILFRSFTESERALTVRLIRTLTPTAIFLPCLQTINASLTAQKKPKYAVLSSVVAVTAKSIAVVLLTKNPAIGIFGIAHATNLAYFLAFLVSFVYNEKVRRVSTGNARPNDGTRKGETYDQSNGNRSRRRAGRCNGKRKNGAL